MAVKAIGEYRFPSRSRQELYGDDQLVNVWFADNPWFCSAGCFRAPKAMSWADFWTQMVVPFAEEDPDWRADGKYVISLHGSQIQPRPDQTLEQLGVGHKDVIAVRTS